MVRVEFSYDYPTLLDMGVEGPYDLLRALPVIWRYATHETLRNTIPAPGTPCAEWKLSPFWRVVQLAIPPNAAGEVVGVFGRQD